MRRAAILAAVCATAAVPANAGDGLAVAVGKALFDRDWVAAPASTRATDGLGPLHNARSCAACHRGGGGAALSLDGQDAPTKPGLVLRLPNDPRYGRQLQTGAVPGQAAEGRVRVSHEDVPVALADGTTVVLRRPRHAIERIADAPPRGPLSPRLAPSLRGVGLLAAVPPATVASLADPDDRDGDGIRGRPGVGRFGLRAEQPGLREQVAEALLLDLGLSTPLRPRPAGDCTAAQADCRALPHGDREGTPGVEIGDEILDALIAYLAALPPPKHAPRSEAGETLFASLGCAACHAPSLPVELADGRRASIAPYTDLLLHNLGPEFADEGGEGDPAARLWRTAPLWGLGPTLAAKETALLHDGRARDAQEAILWHGGEAEAARERFRALAAHDRAELLAFLSGL
jgi:CxxC motif-containing protein (DUF1111 family)